MSSSLRRGALAAAITFSILPLAACSAGNNAQTLQIKPDNAAATAGDIEIQNAIVITQPDRESTGPAVVSATVFNAGGTDQTLESITLPGTGKSAELKPARGGGKLVVPAGGSLILGGRNNASAVLPSSREALQDGDAQKVTFTFSRTGAVSLRAFVFPADGYFSSWGPTEVPAAPGAPASPSGGASEGASASPGESPAASGTPTDAASASASASAPADGPDGHESPAAGH